MEEGIKLSRAAHFSGEGLDHPVEVWHSKLDKNNEIYFTQPYDRSRAMAAVALTATKIDMGEFQATQFVLYPSHAAVSGKECAMLFNAVAYPADEIGTFHPRPDAAQIESKTWSGALMMQHNVHRSIGLPLPFEDRR